ncbi:hypothetical protein AVEN_139965-1 [Araneus ventricosus]|uniref:Uncharacterized protein n=1 Tax=Araneus ventricosus TaxID=182803 RepID=A0A4Y2VCC1_ARAVE|nr:hypothetical protein AVEN_139965-1 [Araneus ventricosus]
MNLRKWVTSSPELERWWKNNEVYYRGCVAESEVTQKVLGLVWNHHLDCLKVDIGNISNMKGIYLSKRSMLSICGMLFDTLGMLTPFMVRMKLLLQNTWERDLQWDEPLPPDIHETFQSWLDEVDTASQISLSRPYFLNTETEPAEMHIFSDASPKAYRCVAYFRKVSDGTISSSFIVAKCRLAPLKKLSLTRLELMGALVSARGKTNPADKLTRGLSIHVLVQDDIWWHGLDCLISQNLSFNNSADSEINETDIANELTKNYVPVMTVTEHYRNDFIDNLLSITNDYTKLIRIISYVFRIAAKCRFPESKKFGPIKADERVCAENSLIHMIQEGKFQEEIKDMKRESIEWKFIPPKSPNFGDISEVGVKSFKFHLKRVIGGQKLTLQEFITILAEIEGVLNSRPFTPLSPEFDDFETLSPGHFLIGRPINGIVE